MVRGGERKNKGKAERFEHIEVIRKEFYKGKCNKAFPEGRVLLCSVNLLKLLFTLESVEEFWCLG